MIAGDFFDIPLGTPDLNYPTKVPQRPSMSPISSISGSSPESSIDQDTCAGFSDVHDLKDLSPLPASSDSGVSTLTLQFERNDPEAELVEEQPPILGGLARAKALTAHPSDSNLSLPLFSADAEMVRAQDQLPEYFQIKCLDSSTAILQPQELSLDTFPHLDLGAAIPAKPILPLLRRRGGSPNLRISIPKQSGK